MVTAEQILGAAQYLRARDGEDEISLERLGQPFDLDAEAVARLLEDDAGNIVGIRFVGDVIVLQFKAA